MTWFVKKGDHLKEIIPYLYQNSDIVNQYVKNQGNLLKIMISWPKIFSLRNND